MPLGVNRTVGSLLPDAIPDSALRRESDNGSAADRQEEIGLIFNTSSDWSDFQAEISSNTDDRFVKAKIVRQSDDAILADKDVSAKTSGDIVTFGSVNLSSGTDYRLTLDGDGSDWTAGFYEETDYLPISSTDGELNITQGYQGGSTFTDFVFSFVEIGNINL